MRKGLSEEAKGEQVFQAEGTASAKFLRQDEGGIYEKEKQSQGGSSVMGKWESVR